MTTLAQRTITPEELHRLCQSGCAVELIDVRTPAEYGEVHASIARLIPLDRLDPASFLRERGDSDAPIYLICHAGARGQKACEKFQQAGFHDVINVAGGTSAWERAGLPVVRGKKAMSLERQTRIVFGSLVLLGVTLGWWIHPVFLAPAALMGAGLIFAGITDRCGLAMLLAKAPWNRGETPPTCSIS